MSPIETQFAQIFIHYYSHKSSSTCKQFKSEPTQNQEDQMGRLFGILEINTPSKENSQIITQLINYLEDAYYGQIEHEQIDIEQAFETALKEVNQKFLQLMQEKKIYLVGNLNEHTIKEKINFAVGIIKENQLYLTYLNNISIFLVHKTKQDHKLINIKNIATDEADGKTHKDSDNLFQNLIHGEVNPQDYLFMANSSFLEHVSLERIKKTITSLPIHKAAEYFKNSLLRFEGFNFAAVIIKNSIPETGFLKDSQSLTSITELNSTELSTENLLTPSFWNKLNSFFKKVRNFFGSVFTNYQQNENKITEHQTHTQPNNSMPYNSTSGSGSKIKTTLHNFFINSKKPFKQLYSRSSFLYEKMPKFKYYLRIKFIILGNYLKKIPNLSKILLGVAFLFIVLFIYSTSYFKHQKTTQDDLQGYQELINQIDQKKNEAESNIIFGDEVKAKAEIVEAQNLLTQLPVESQKQKDKYQEITKSIQAVISKLRHITIIEEPTLIADLNPENPETFNLNNILYKDNQLYIFDSQSNNSYIIKLNEPQPQKYTANLNDIGKIIKAKLINNQILLYHDKNGFIEYLDNKYRPLEVSTPANAKIADFATYNNRLYTIDPANKQIYRHPLAENGYATGVTWLNDSSVDLSGVISFGIDTNIWLLDKNGAIYKLTKGKKQSFETKDIEPPLEAPTQLITNDETNNIYILEPKNKRIVVIDKEGKLITQYYNDNFDNLTSFAVVEKEKKVFIVNNNIIYFFNLIAE